MHSQGENERVNKGRKEGKHDAWIIVGRGFEVTWDDDNCFFQAGSRKHVLYCGCAKGPILAEAVPSPKPLGLSISTNED